MQIRLLGVSVGNWQRRMKIGINVTLHGLSPAIRETTHADEEAAETHSDGGPEHQHFSSVREETYPMGSCFHHTRVQI